MTRPRTGQRKLGTAPVTSAAAWRGSDDSVAGVASRAVAVGWAAATCTGVCPLAAAVCGLAAAVWVWAAAADGAGWCAAGAAAAVLVAVLIWLCCTPGMARRWP